MDMIVGGQLKLNWQEFRHFPVYWISVSDARRPEPAVG